MVTINKNTLICTDIDYVHYICTRNQDGVGPTTVFGSGIMFYLYVPPPPPHTTLLPVQGFIFPIPTNLWHEGEVV